MRDLKEWEKDMPLGNNNLIWQASGQETEKALKLLEKEGKVLTPFKRQRELARKYEKKFGVKVKVGDSEAFEENPFADGLHTYSYGKDGKPKSIVHLHPILQYYPEKYVIGIIEHEIDHAMVERKWNDKL